MELVMFRRLILEALTEGAKSTTELYDIARNRQPHDCDGTPCPHRQILSSRDQEWMHELRRNQYQLKREGRVVLNSGKWSLI